MSVSLNAIATLVQQIESLMDDSNRDVFALYMGRTGSEVQMDATLFLSEFVDFEVYCREGLGHPYELSALIFGVKFYTIMPVAGIVDLKTSMPNQFDYIQSKVQVDVA